MSGIDKIIKQIEDDTALVCSDIIDTAKVKAQAIIDKAHIKAEAISKENVGRIASAVTDITARGESSAALEEKKILLSAKHGIITDMIDAATADLKALPDDEYFALILRMIEKNAQDSRGVIRMNVADLSRLPADFEQKMNDAAKGGLVLSREPIDIDAGFVLVYGGIEENCSFDAIFASEHEYLYDRATRLLFRGREL